MRLLMNEDYDLQGFVQLFWCHRTYSKDFQVTLSIDHVVYPLQFVHTYDINNLQLHSINILWWRRWKFIPSLRSRQNQSYRMGISSKSNLALHIQELLYSPIGHLIVRQYNFHQFLSPSFLATHSHYLSMISSLD